MTLEAFSDKIKEVKKGKVSKAQLIRDMNKKGVTQKSIFDFLAEKDIVENTNSGYAYVRNVISQANRPKARSSNGEFTTAFAELYDIFKAHYEDWVLDLSDQEGKKMNELRNLRGELNG